MKKGNIRSTILYVCSAILCLCSIIGFASEMNTAFCFMWLSLGMLFLSLGIRASKKDEKDDQDKNQ